MALRVTVLASGSSGNVTLVECPGGRVLIDLGISEREASRRLRSIGVDPASIDAVLITHEHGDHVSGAARFSRRHGVPLYATSATAAAAGLDASSLAGLALFEAARPFEAGGMAIRPFTVPHDAADTVGFVVEHEGSRAGYATDLGYPSALAMERLRGCSALVVEANHDLSMLRSGPYPAHVKQRVMGRSGHLSNEQAAEMLRETATASTRAVFLAHLSERNNDVRVALEAGREALRSVGRDAVRVEMTFRGHPSAGVEV